MSLSAMLSNVTADQCVSGIAGPQIIVPDLTTPGGLSKNAISLLVVVARFGGPVGIRLDGSRSAREAATEASLVARQYLDALASGQKVGNPPTVDMDEYGAASFNGVLLGYLQGWSKRRADSTRTVVGEGDDAYFVPGNLTAGQATIGIVIEARGKLRRNEGTQAYGTSFFGMISEIRKYALDSKTKDQAEAAMKRVFAWLAVAYPNDFTRTVATKGKDKGDVSVEGKTPVGQAVMNGVNESLNPTYRQAGTSSASVSLGLDI